MLSSVQPGGMTQTQKELVECALRILTRVSPSPWNGVPQDMHRCFEKYMEKDVWTGESDLASLREAAVMILCDAITHTGEFADQQA